MANKDNRSPGEVAESVAWEGIWQAPSRDKQIELELTRPGAQFPRADESTTNFPTRPPWLCLGAWGHMTGVCAHFQTGE